MKYFKKAIFLILFLAVILIVQDWENKKTTSHTSGPLQEAELVRIVDGDTFVVTVDGVEERVRIIGIDTPESVKPNSPVECFGKEASEHLESLLEAGDIVLLEFDPTQAIRDRHNRLLTHVFKDDSNIGQRMVAEGYAYEYTYKDPYIYQSLYQEAENSAQQNKFGLWSLDSCGENK